MCQKALQECIKDQCLAYRSPLPPGAAAAGGSPFHLVELAAERATPSFTVSAQAEYRAKGLRAG